MCFLDENGWTEEERQRGAKDQPLTDEPIRAATKQEAQTLVGTAQATGFDGAAYLAANPDVAAEAAKQTAIGKSDTYGMTPEEFAAYHYEQFGKNEGRDLGAAAATGGTGATNAGGSLVTDITKGFNDAVTGITNSNQGVIDKLTGLNTSLVGQLTAQGQQFANSQKELLQGINDAGAKQSAALAKALKDMQDAANASGQAEKRPSYSRALAKNKDANSGGLSSTMLTGAGGVAPGTMSLGRTSLLGA